MPENNPAWYGQFRDWYEQNMQQYAANPEQQRQFHNYALQYYNQYIQKSRQDKATEKAEKAQDKQAIGAAATAIASPLAFWGARSLFAKEGAKQLGAQLGKQALAQGASQAAATQGAAQGLTGVGAGSGVGGGAGGAGVVGSGAGVGAAYLAAPMVLGGLLKKYAFEDNDIPRTFNTDEILGNETSVSNLNKQIPGFSSLPKEAQAKILNESYNRGFLRLPGVGSESGKTEDFGAYGAMLELPGQRAAMRKAQSDVLNSSNTPYHQFTQSLLDPTKFQFGQFTEDRKGNKAFLRQGDIEKRDAYLDFIKGTLAQQQAPTFPTMQGGPSISTGSMSTKDFVVSPEQEDLFKRFLQGQR